MAPTPKDGELSKPIFLGLGRRPDNQHEIVGRPLAEPPPPRTPWPAGPISEGAGPMVGRHRLLEGRRLRATLVPMVDIFSLVTHLVTPDGAAAGRAAKGRYVALCGVHVFPAEFTQPPGNGYCQSCRTSSIPPQRSGTAR